MVANTTALNTIGVQMMSSEERQIIVDIPGIGVVYNELPRVATELGLDVASLARASNGSWKTVRRIWDNDMTGVTFSTLVSLLVALDKPFEEVFPYVQDPRYFNPYVDKKNGDL